jgi:hypothetical protein
MVTEYPNANLDLGPVSIGRAFTAVVSLKAHQLVPLHPEGR